MSKMEIVKPKGYDAIRYSRSEEYLALTNNAIMDLGKGSRSIGWISKLVKGARKMSKAL
jgi:hypothetical protein